MSTVGIAAFLDDPMLSLICWGDLKKFLCISDGGSTRARYNNPTWTENQFRVVADNEFDVITEPADDNRTRIEPQEFMKTMQKPFGCLPELHVWAVLGRCIIVVTGENRLYIASPTSSGMGQSIASPMQLSGLIGWTRKPNPTTASSSMVSKRHHHLLKTTL